MAGGGTLSERMLFHPNGLADVLVILPKDGGISGITSKGIQGGEGRVEPTSGYTLHTVQDTIVIMEEGNRPNP